MDLYSITVYRNLEELRKIQDEREVNPFIFGNTKDNIDYCPEICVDISALIHLLLTNKSNIESAYINLANMTEDTLIIVEENLADKVLELLPLSIFLYGESGIGKTEVARLIANGLQDKCYLAKINFQNYSSQDALNSLIGSPAGYVGCEHGELSDKIKKSKVGVLLCDEFEKTTRPVFSYFLELLEEGKFTDSMTREYDLDGYIIIFTSNLPNETEYKKVIPPELQTRFDLVCEFEEPTAVEKKDFLDLLLEKAKSKYSEQFARITMTEDEKQKLYSFDYSSISALRDIKRVFNNRLMDYFAEKDVL